jgi:hypothetical protein
MALMLIAPRPQDPNMGNILGDAWSWAKKNPLAIVAPPFYVAQQTLKAVPGVISVARSEVQQTVAAFRPAPPPSQVDALTAGLATLGSAGASGGELGSSSSLPIILGAGAAGLLLLLAFGRKRKP